jgi:UDP-glucose 4-epimerase
MRVVVTGSTGHLGEALVRVLSAQGHDVVGVDLRPSAFTTVAGSICDRDLAADVTVGADVVIHSATLHKPHVETHSTQSFIETNISGTAVRLKAASDAGVRAFVFASTTSAFGQALSPAEGQPATWITEEVMPVVNNIYGATKVAAEDLCQLAYPDRGMACVVLRISRFFPEDDDDENVRSGFSSENAKANELLYRRVDLADAVTACPRAAERAERIGFGRYIVSATTPFTSSDLPDLRHNAPAVLRRLYPEYEALYASRGWLMFGGMDRVYVNTSAREPRHDFGWVLEQLRSGSDITSPLAAEVGAKGYHSGPVGCTQFGTHRSVANHDA